MLFRSAYTQDMSLEQDARAALRAGAVTVGVEETIATELRAEKLL